MAKVQFLKTLWEETFYQEVIQVQINSWTLGGTEKCRKFWLLLYLDMQPKASWMHDFSPHFNMYSSLSALFFKIVL